MYWGREEGSLTSQTFVGGKVNLVTIDRFLWHGIQCPSKGREEGGYCDCNANVGEQQEMVFVCTICLQLSLIARM